MTQTQPELDSETQARLSRFQIGENDMTQNTKEKTSFAMLAQELGKMGCEELEKLNQMLVRVLKQKRKMENVMLIGTFIEGQKVRMKPEHQTKRPYDAAGIVKKVNETKLVIEFVGEPGLWNVPPSMLYCVEDDSKRK